MDVLYRAEAMCLVSSILALVIRRNTPELALLLSAAAGIAVCVLCAEMLREVLSSVRRIAETGGISDTLLRPVIKCTVIGLVTDFTAKFCRDAGQSAAAAIMEFCGSVCALYAALPLITSLFDAVAGLL